MVGGRADAKLTRGRLLSARQPAPDSTLHSTPDQTLSLSQLRGHPVVRAFYPADWSPVCGDQMALYNELLSEFRRFHATVIGISVDGAWCHAAFALDRKLHFPLLADFEPKGGLRACTAFTSCSMGSAVVILCLVTFAPGGR
ncbi:hypothetical protein CSC74_03045 [Pseudoxanthomonas yeongjuensis]|nr:redoxin domain-containing protein [Pseudoxanthomonas yeongjuensis]KAF1717897.1 hypothetical protein CSC74_03045 [Pseudoxanthomonas yeongjuensis]